MLKILANLLMVRMFNRDRRGGVATGMTNNRAATALGTIATVAAPFIIRKLLEKRAQRQQPA